MNTHHRPGCTGASYHALLGGEIKTMFLVQSFFETLQYCDEGRKFNRVIHSYIHTAWSVSLVIQLD